MYHLLPATEDRWVVCLTVQDSPRWAVKPRDKSAVAANSLRREICLLSHGLLSARILDFDHETLDKYSPSNGLTHLGQNTISSSAIIAQLP
ncbi:uncharacterized protein NPIL_332131 [Nephila pilipes]|uniref:Uncharacterized protein n=1 Tax=Nephila pilipes TaxID=299642 RepID=A0A8X6UFT5_NEPPI|nr:uncharacterized protein NPIL_332131 [Nephila pilipes]